MIGLSVAVGRFVEALFWAIVRVAGWVTVAALLALLCVGGIWFAARKLVAGRRR